MGIRGAGLSLVLSYAVILALMYVFTQRLFTVPYEWGRLLQALGLATALVLGAELLLPTDGFVGFVTRLGVWALYPLSLWGSGFLHDEERRAAGNLLRPATIAEALRNLREGESPEVEPDDTSRPGRPRLTRETLEAEQRDEDARY
jgi:hypothetical protein